MLLVYSGLTEFSTLGVPPARPTAKLCSPGETMGWQASGPSVGQALAYAPVRKVVVDTVSVI